MGPQARDGEFLAPIIDRSLEQQGPSFPFRIKPDVPKLSPLPPVLEVGLEHSVLEVAKAEDQARVRRAIVDLEPDHQFRRLVGLDDELGLEPDPLVAHLLDPLGLPLEDEASLIPEGPGDSVDRQGEFSLVSCCRLELDVLGCELQESAAGLDDAFELSAGRFNVTWKQLQIGRNVEGDPAGGAGHLGERGAE